MKTFEELLELTHGLAVPANDSQRALEWCDDGQVVALAKQSQGAVEVFVCGPQLRPTLSLVRRHMRYDEWQRAEGNTFAANRIVLPADPHFAAVAAFLVEELLRTGITTSREHAFAQAEPLLDMALRGLAPHEQTIVGLLGELVFLERLLQAASSVKQRAAMLEAWQGYSKTARDFVFSGPVAVEVKTTRGAVSSHHVNNIRQTDPKRTPDGVASEQLYMLSIGLTEFGNDDALAEALTLPTQVDSVLQLLGPEIAPGSRNEIQELFLARVAEFGEKGRCYRHDEMREWSAFGDCWKQLFLRVYDMNPDEVDVLRLADVSSRRFVPVESVRFTVNLPDHVGGTNPSQDLNAFVSTLLGKH